MTKNFISYTNNKSLQKRVRHLNNRDLSILFGVFMGFAVAIYGLIFDNFCHVPVIGDAINQNMFMRFLAVLLSGGIFGTFLSYVGICIDLITNHKTIIDLYQYIFDREQRALQPVCE